MNSHDSRAYEVIDQLAEEFATRYRRGERPSIQEFIDRHPDLADVIRELLPAMVEIEQAKHEVRQGEDPGAVAAPPMRQMGDYHLLREIGRGGMGVVYEAEQLSLNRRVALKILPTNLFPDARQQRRFEREARSAARLHHTNIVPIFGVGQHDNLPYYVMQLIQGLGLDDVIDELRRMHPGGPQAAGSPNTPGELHVWRKDISVADVARSLVTGVFQPPPDSGSAPSGVTVDHRGATQSGEEKPATAGRHSDTFTLSSTDSLPSPSGTDPNVTYWQSVARIGVQVASALAYAHEQGVLHRDVKPGNLLLDTRGTVWVTDFGLAKAEGAENLTHTGDILGTVRYMPPEAFEGRSEPRSDLYALGLTLYELLALRPAFDEKERNRLIRQVMSSEAPRLDSINPAIPRDLVTIVHKAIEKEPAQRYACAADLQADLQRFLDDEPILARRVSSVERLGRWARHNRGLAGALSAIALLLLAVAVGSTLAAWRLQNIAAERAELADEKEQERGKAVKAKDDAERDRAEAERQRKLADANFAKARRAVDEYRKAGQEMVKVEGLRPLGEELLRSALKFYEGYLRGHPDDPAIRRDLASAHLQVAHIHLAMGRRTQARQSYEEAQRRFEQLAAADPKDSEARAGLAECLGRLGKHAEAIAILRDLVKPEDPRFQAELAQAYSAQAIKLQNEKKLQEALKAHQESLAFRERLVRLEPDNAEHERDLGQTLNNMGVLLSNSMGNYPEALRLYRRAAEGAQATYERSNHDLLTGRSLAIYLRNVSIVERHLGRDEEALRSLVRATDVCRQLAADFYALPVTHSMLYTYGLELSRLQAAAGDKPAAQRSLFLAGSALARLPRATPADLANLAAARALAASMMGDGKNELSAVEKAEQQKEADAALDALKKAVAGGYDNVAALKTSTDLAILRPRADFKQLLGKVEVAAAAAEAKRERIKLLRTELAEVEKQTRSNSAGAAQKLKAHQRQAELNQELAALGQAVPNLKADLASSRHAAGLIQVGLAQYEEASRSLGEARSIREELLGKEPKNPQRLSDLASTHLALGSLHRADGRLGDAARSWEKSLELMQGAVKASRDGSAFARQLAAGERTVGGEYAQLGLWEEAAAHYSRALGRDLSGTISDCRTQALLFLLAKDVDGYRRHCRKMHERFGARLENVGSWDQHYLTTSWSIGADGTDDVEDLIKEVEAFARARKESWTNYYVALALYRGKRFEEADKLLPNFTWHQALALKAMVSHQLGKKDEALSLLAKVDALHEKALRQSAREPEKPYASAIDPNIFQDRLQFLILREEAHRLIHKSPPPDPLAHLHRARLYAQIGQKKKAEALIELARAVRPTGVRGWLLRAQGFHSVGRGDLADGDLAEAIKLNSTDPVPWIEYGHYWVEQGGQKKADEAFARAAKAAPDRLHHFPRAGWWVVGGLPGGLELSSPPAVFADPSKPVPSFDSRKELRWRAVLPNDEGALRLESLLAGNRSAFALTYLYSSKERPVLLKVGGKHRVRFWLNGRLIHEATRGDTYSWNLDLVPVTLRAGRNTLLAGVDGPAIDQDRTDLSLVLRVADHPMDRGYLLAQLGLWKEAVEEYDRVCGDLPSVLREWTGDTWGHYPVCCMAGGDDERLRKYRAELLRAWAGSKSKWETNVLALTLAGAPGSDVEPETLLRYAEPAHKSHWWRPFIQAAALYRAEKYDKAIDLILNAEGLKNLPPSIPAPWALLAMTYQRLGKKDEARDSLAKVEEWYDALVKEPDESDQPILDYWMTHLALNVIFYREAKLLIDKKDLKDDPRWKAVQEHNRKWLQKRDPDAAAYDLAIALRPDLSDLRLARARRHAECKRDKEADADFQKAVELWPQFPKTWKQRGLVYAGLGMHDRAASDFLEALKLLPEPDADHWWPDKEGVYAAILSSDEVFKRVARERPKDRALLMMRLHRLGSRGSWKEALAVGKKLIELNPDSLEVRSYCAPLFLEAGDQAGYRRQCEELLKRHGDVTAARLVQRVAFACLLTPKMQVDAQKVRRLADRAAADTDAGLAARGALTLALAELRTGNEKAVIAQIQKVRTKEAGDEIQAVAFTVLAMAHHSRNRKEEARRSLAQAKAMTERRQGYFERGQGYGSEAHVFLACRILLREAEALIEGKAPR